jgi:predicted nucleic acid-binding protein
MSRGASDEEATSADRTLLVDASVFITLTAIDAVGLLGALDGETVVPERVADELVDDRSRAALADARECGEIRIVRVEERLDEARAHLGTPDGDRGDVGLLAHALASTDSVVAVTDDKPLRDACKALSIPVSGSIGVLVRAVERGGIEPDSAKDKLYAMDEVGARLSTTLVRRGERLIDDASG